MACDLQAFPKKETAAVSDDDERDCECGIGRNDREVYEVQEKRELRLVVGIGEGFRVSEFEGTAPNR